MTKEKIPKSFGAHDGVFHADEVTACALLILFDRVDKEKICRSRDPEKLNQCEYVCDVGGVYDEELKLFDHHQADYTGEMSSAGLVLRYLKKEQLISLKEYEFFQDSLVKGVDAHDNGRHPQIKGFCYFSDVIDSFNPISYEAPDFERDEAFKEAVSFALTFLKRSIDAFRYRQSSKEIVKIRMEEDEMCLFFNQSIPWIESFFELGGVDHPAKFVIMPAGKHWKLRGIPPNSNDLMSVRVPLPEEWAGRLEGELKEVSGINGAIFCHKQRFISVWETKEAAMEALEYVLSKEIVNGGRS